MNTHKTKFAERNERLAIFHKPTYLGCGVDVQYNGEYLTLSRPNGDAIYLDITARRDLRKYLERIDQLRLEDFG